MVTTLFRLFAAKKMILNFNANHNVRCTIRNQKLVTLMQALRCTNTHLCLLCTIRFYRDLEREILSTSWGMGNRFPYHLNVYHLMGMSVHVVNVPMHIIFMPDLGLYDGVRGSVGWRHYHLTLATCVVHRELSIDWGRCLKAVVVVESEESRSTGIDSNWVTFVNLFCIESPSGMKWRTLKNRIRKSALVICMHRGIKPIKRHRTEQTRWSWN